MSKHYDLEAAKQNIDLEITTIEESLTKLRQARELISTSNEGLIDVLELVNRYGRTKPTPAPRESAASNDSSVSDQIVDVVINAERPVRINDVLARMGERFKKTLSYGRVSYHLSALVQAKRIRKFKRGLFGPLTAPANGSAVAAQALAREPKLGQRETALLLKDRIEAVLRANKKPLSGSTILEHLVAQGFRFTGTPKFAVKRALDQIKGVRASGPHNRHRTYSIKS